MITIKSNQEKLLVLTDQALVSGVNFVIGIILARYLGLANYGLFALAWMAVLFASSLHQAFIISPLYSIYPKQEDKKQYLASLMGVQVLFSMLTYVFTYCILSITVHFYPEWGNGVNFHVLSGLVSAFVFNDYLRRLFFTLHKPISVLLMDVIGYGLQPILVFILYLNGFLTLESTFAVLLILLSGSILFSLLFTYREGLVIKHLAKVLKINWNYSKFLLGTALLQWFSGNFFIVVSAGIIGPLAVGAIRMAQNVVGILHILFLAMENMVPIRASEILISSGSKKMMQYMFKITKQAALPTLGLLGLIAIFRNQILELFYGIESIEYHYVLLAFCVLYVFVFVGTMLRFVIRTVEHNGVIFISYIVSAGFSFLAAKPIVEFMGLAGVLLGLFAVQLLTLGIYFYSLKSELKWGFK